MKIFAIILKFNLLPAILIFQSSCVSSAIERATNKHRDVLVDGKSRTEIREEVGAPIGSWEKSSGVRSSYQANGSHAYDIFNVQGVVAREGDGAAQATVSAVTLGTSEAISLPFTLADTLRKPFVHQTLVVFYNRDFDYMRHWIYDSHGRKVDTLGY